MDRAMSDRLRRVPRFQFAGWLRLQHVQDVSLKTLLLAFLAINAFAVVQPMLERLGANGQYLVLEDFSATAIWVTVLLLLSTVPVSLWILIAVLRRLRANRAAAILAIVVVWIFSVLGMLVVARWVSRSANLLMIGVPDTGLALGAVVGGIGATVLFFRADWYRQLLCLSAAGCVLFPYQFAMVPAVHDRVWAASASDVADSDRASRPAPVMMIVFDGLCGMALLDERHEIDRVRYPGFARLGDSSTFYRNATTVHTRTDHAVPAILSGRLPEEVWQPVDADYPRSLFRLIYNTRQFDMTVFEPVTRLSPAELRQLENDRTPAEQVRLLLEVLVSVYVNVTLPQDIDGIEVDIPRTWFGIVKRPRSARSTETGVIVYGFDASRDIQCAHFHDMLTSGSKPGFKFLHVVVPHDPFSLLPSGVSTVRVSDIADPLYGSSAEDWCLDPWPVQRAWQRYLLQLQFADRWLNRFLDRLEETGELDKTLIVVTGDHGMAFVPGAGRRTPTEATLSEIVSVPLFIKRPGQKMSVVTDRNVETIDVLPTIADELGLPMDASWDGQSLLDDRLPPRSRKIVRGAVDTVLGPDLPQRFLYVDRMIEAFGTGEHNDRLTNLNLEPELVGRRLDAMSIEAKSELQARLIVGGSRRDPELADVVPCYLHGQLLNRESDHVEHRLAIALNGVIQATTRTSVDRVCCQEWAALLPEDAYRPGQNALQVFELLGTGDELTLHEVELEPFPS